MSSYSKSGAGSSTNLVANSYLFLFLVVTLFFTFQNRDQSSFWNADTEGYYLYLPALIIHQGFAQLPVKNEEIKRFSDSGLYFTKHTYGVALMQLPFFLVAHVAALISGTASEGYEAYYQLGIVFAALFYGFLGLFYLRKTLERNFSGWITLLTLVCLFFGTNLYFYTASASGMSHIYSFCLFSILLYNAPYLYDSVKFKTYAFFGFLIGLIILIRPTNAVILLFLLFYQIRSLGDMRKRLYFFVKHIWEIPFILVFAVLVCLPQLFYWHEVTGQWFFYAYQEEGFSNWKTPKALQLLFDFKNGWLLYNPLFIISIVGLFIGAWKNKYNIRWIALAFFVALVVYSSWWCWWYEPAFGQRSLVEYYPFLAIPFAYVSHLIFRQKFWGLKILYVSFIAISIYYNQLLIANFTAPGYDFDRWNAVMTNLF